MATRKVYRLSDNVIAQIVRLIQFGILSGTDVSDHFRQLVLEPDVIRPGFLALTPEYKEKEARDVETMFEQLDELMASNPDINGVPDDN